jgi:hypothetical protein
MMVHVHLTAAALFSLATFLTAAEFVQAQLYPVFARKGGSYSISCSTWLAGVILKFYDGLKSDDLEGNLSSSLTCWSTDSSAKSASLAILADCG